MRWMVVAISAALAILVALIGGVALASEHGSSGSESSVGSVHRTAARWPHRFPFIIHAVESSTDLPTERVWLRDVTATLKKARVRAYLVHRASHPRPGDHRLAINLDIDNTVNETYYRGYNKAHPIPSMRRLVRAAHGLGYGILFNTGRPTAQRAQTRKLLKLDGYPIDRLCMRRPGERVSHSKKRCRRAYRNHGWTLVANIGNTHFDLDGRGYEIGVQLPNYGYALG